MKAVLRRTVGPLVCFALFIGAAACETAKSANPLSPTIAGPMEGVTITPPKLLEPLANQQIRDKDQPFTVVIENAASTSPRPYVMRVQVATDINFSTVVWSRDGISPGEGGQTRFVMPERLASGRNYYWRAQADDGANRSEWSGVLGFEVLMPTFFGVPVPQEPVANVVVSTTRPLLSVANATAQGPVAQAFYTFQVSANAGFSDLLVHAQVPQQGGTTSITSDSLPYGQTYYWRVRVTDGETTGDWSKTETFRTGAAPAPGPAPIPNPGAACGPPYPQTPLGIIQCQRSKYGYMSSSEIVTFLVSSAKDLNGAGVAGGPFGILVKPGGHNCLGFSCDILCSGNGGSQRQWDVLSDAEGAQIPKWGEISPIIVRTCQIQ